MIQERARQTQGGGNDDDRVNDVLSRVKEVTNLVFGRLESSFGEADLMVKG